MRNLLRASDFAAFHAFSSSHGFVGRPFACYLFFFSCGETVFRKGIWLCDAPFGVMFTSFFTEACVRSFWWLSAFLRGRVPFFPFSGGAAPVWRGFVPEDAGGIGAGGGATGILDAEVFRPHLRRGLYWWRFVGEGAGARGRGSCFALGLGGVERRAFPGGGGSRNHPPKKKKGLAVPQRGVGAAQRADNMPDSPRSRKKGRFGRKGRGGVSVAKRKAGMKRRSGKGERV